MKLSQCFHGVEVGGYCASTIHFHNLNSSTLLDRGIIKRATRKVVCGTEERPFEVEVSDYTFQGVK